VLLSFVGLLQWLSLSVVAIVGVSLVRCCVILGVVGVVEFCWCCYCY